MHFHYALARAYFVENYQPQFKSYFASYLQFLLWQYKDHETYGLVAIQDFFQGDVKLNKAYLAKEFIFNLIRLSIIALKKMIT